MSFSDEYWNRSLDRTRSIKGMLWRMYQNPNMTFNEVKAEWDTRSKTRPEHCDVCGEGLVAFNTSLTTGDDGKDYVTCGRLCSRSVRSKNKFAYKVARKLFVPIEKLLRILDSYR